MQLHKKTFYLLAFSCLVLAFAILLYFTGVARGKMLQEQRNALMMAEQQITQLQHDIERYESARGKIEAAGGREIARHEKVSISSSFTPAELPRLNSVLSHAYDIDGFLLLQNFSLRWSEYGTSEGEKQRAGTDATLSLSLVGEKIFTE